MLPIILSGGRNACNKESDSQENGGKETRQESGCGKEETSSEETSSEESKVDWT
jgi:hypothetical protein